MRAPSGLTGPAASGAIAQVRRLLSETTRVRIRARDTHGTRLVGEGDVVATAGPDGSLLLAEAGAWRDRDGGPVRFSNACRWRFGHNAISLAHERRGRAHAVPLVELAPAGPHRWISREAHRCGRDEYAASARISEHGLVLRWRVRGPRKLQLLRVEYSRHSDPATHGPALPG